MSLWRIIEQERIHALEQCRFIVLVCDECGQVTEREATSCRDDLYELVSLVADWRKTYNEIALHERARALFEHFPDSLHPVRVRSLGLKSAGMPDPAFEAALRADTEVCEWLCPTIGSNSGYSSRSHQDLLDNLPLYEKLFQEKIFLRCPHCGRPALYVPESFIEEQLTLFRRQRAVLARQLKDAAAFPTFNEVFMTPEPARYYTDENDHNPLIISECLFCGGSGQEGDGNETFGICAVCLGVGITAEEPYPRFARDILPVEVSVDPDGCVTCPECTHTFSLNDPTAWTGRRHQLCGQKIIPIPWNNMQTS